MTDPEEYLYALSNPAMPGLLKIGRTNRDVAGRAAELSAFTGIPCPFVVELTVPVHDSRYAERDVHQILHKQRVSLDREFFRCSMTELQDAIVVVKRVDNARFKESQRFGAWLAGKSSVADIPKVIHWFGFCEMSDVIAALRREAA